MGTGCSSCRLTDAASQADARALTLASLSTGLTATMNAVVTRCAPKITMAQVRPRCVLFLFHYRQGVGSENVATLLCVIQSVVNYDGDCLNGDGMRPASPSCRIS